MTADILGPSTVTRKTEAEKPVGWLTSFNPRLRMVRKLGILFCHYEKRKKRRKILPFVAPDGNFEGIVYNEISHKEKDKYRMISHVESKKS